MSVRSKKKRRLVFLLVGALGLLGLGAGAYFVRMAQIERRAVKSRDEGLIALRAGYRTAALASVDDLKVPTNYHWPTDTPDNVDYSTVADCARLCRRVLERLAA